MESNIAVMDCDSIIYTAFHPKKVLDENNEPVRKDNKFVYEEKTEEEIIESCDDVMHMILTNCNATHYIAYVKGLHTIKHRVEVNPLYKANRSSEPPKNWNLCKNYLIEKWGVIEAHNYEVDDYVNVTRLTLKDAFIVAIDKDLLSLEAKDKMHYNWRKNEWIDVSKFVAERIFWSDMIIGQKGDNLTGIPGKGEAYVKKLFNDVLIQSNDHFSSKVFDDYFSHYGEEQGIKEFYKNYISLKILDKIDGFIPPTPIKYEKIGSEDDKLKLNF